MLEKITARAIKVFSEFEKKIIDTISLLLKTGYREVHLITDHGYVLTGLLTKRIKCIRRLPERIKSERFIRTVENNRIPIGLISTGSTKSIIML